MPKVTQDTPTIEKMERQVMASIKAQVADFERVNGLVKPAPPWAQLPKRHSKKQAISIMKRELVRLGEYVPPDQQPTQEVRP